MGEQAQGRSGPGEALPVEKQTDWEDHSVEIPKESSSLREHSEATQQHSTEIPET